MDSIEQNNKDRNIQFLQFGNQDLPAFIEVKGKNWIYYGEKNDFPYYLIDLYTQSSYHKAIIDGKVSYIAGNGWNVSLDGLNTEQKAIATNLLNQPFGNQNLNDATLSWSKDAELFNGMCFKVSWHKDKKSATLTYIDMCNIRTNAEQTEFYYTAHWFKTNSKGDRVVNNFTDKNAPSDFKVYPKYDPKDRTGEQIYYWKEHHPDQKVYPIPVYQGAVTWINVDIDLAKYFYHTVRNSFVPTHLINFNNGEPSPEKAKQIEEGVKDKWTKPDGQRIIVSFNQTKDSAATIETLSMTDADKQYESVRKYSEQAIITGHRVSSGMLFGMYREGSLGGRSELQFAEEHFQNSYVASRQHILEQIINMFADDFGINATFYLNKVKRVGWVPSDEVVVKMLDSASMEKLIYDHLGIKKPETLTPLQPAQFKSEITDDDLISFFEKRAIDCSDYEVVSERCMGEFSSREDVESSERAFMAEHFEFSLKASQLERTIIDLLSKDGSMQPEAIANAAKTSVDKVKDAIKSLVDRKVLSTDKLDANGEPMKGYTVNEKGADILDEKPAKTAPLKVVYRYGLAPRFKGDPEDLGEGRTRKWCRDMLRLSNGTATGKPMRWTSEQIFALNPGEDINPWLQRGGWYTKPGTDVHVPQCRHSWHQQLLKKKEGE